MTPDPKRDPLKIGNETGRWKTSVGDLRSYREPWEDILEGEEHKILTWNDLAKSIHVSPSDPGREAKNPNVVKQPGNEFLFLDVGRWLTDSRGQPRDFGLIWGRHVYLCSFKPLGFSNPPDFGRPGLDSDFFRGMGNSAMPVQWASASWALEENLDWDYVYVITADMHLMGQEQARAWYGDGARFMQPERDFWQFAERITEIPSLQGKIKYIQIGDSYDLWVDCKPAQFVASPTARTVDLKPGAADIVTSWIKRITGLGDERYRSSNTNWVYHHLNTGLSSEELDKLPSDLRSRIINRANEFGTANWKRYVIEGRDKVWRNPADAALKLLEDRMGRDNVVYIYGNHDDYLADGGVCARAGIMPRQRCTEFKGVFIEHGHRLEIPEVVTHPPGTGFNSDGLCVEAWESTNSVYDYLAGKSSSAGSWLKGKAQQNINIVDSPMPKFAPDWAKYVVNFGAWILLDLIPGGLTQVLTGGKLKWDLPGHLPADIAWTSGFDQPWFIQEYARVWVGRNSNLETTRRPPHVFVIGHTHLPMLAHMTVTRD